ncbi:DNA-binding response regulator [Paenibacillus psychroresistens]|uniref:DNA-binding response regulator n=1 Tax=Paenibacillus psychroresistens TaxID=1778678 RepID=A0A6B8RKA0_9BACL|nr:response regulator transcription factor [Paenibacillus psychroresistens]QGQ96015.1 DNA-binding response regulator [Paenibacillus psychroresistens]
MSKPLKVIIVDDHPLMAEATKHLLEQIEGIQVIDIASSGKKGLELIDLHKPDMVFLDYQLPDKVGTDVAKEIKTKYPAIHIIIFTGVDVSDMINNFLALQVSGVISKGTSRTAIKNMIGVILEDHIVLPRSALNKIRLTDYTQDPLLSQDEVIIMSMVVKGATLDQIGERIHISKRSVDNYQRKIYEKLGVETRAEAIEKFIKSHYYTDSQGGV